MLIVGCARPLRSWRNGHGVGDGGNGSSRVRETLRPRPYPDADAADTVLYRHGGRAWRCPGPAWAARDAHGVASRARSGAHPNCGLCQRGCTHVQRAGAIRRGGGDATSDCGHGGGARRGRVAQPGDRAHRSRRPFADHGEIRRHIGAISPRRRDKGCSLPAWTSAALADARSHRRDSAQYGADGRGPRSVRGAAARLPSGLRPTPP
mmetsp:Transcript_66166/g.156269  ORF Transcript_66166/g.156269 Transcript_66166/m.156269 type:complete len:207 (-) Transcript_66166:573-1193(-)